MGKRVFDISKSGYETIKISADDGLIIDDWKDLTAPSCLVFGVGRFRIEDLKTVFIKMVLAVFLCCLASLLAMMKPETLL